MARRVGYLRFFTLYRKSREMLARAGTTRRITSRSGGGSSGKRARAAER